MFNKINNAITRSEIVDNSVVENNGYADKIWPIGEAINKGDGELVNVNRGQTYIRGQLYKISDDDTKLLPLTGSQEYDIKKDVLIHAYENIPVIKVLVPIDGTNPV